MSDLTSQRAEMARLLRAHESFVLLSHVRPDGDAIGSQLALGGALEALGKRVRYLNEDGLPENLAFMVGSERIEKSSEIVHPVEAEVMVALDTADKPRLGAASLKAVEGVPTVLNIDHHQTNPGYGDAHLIDAQAPSTTQILYELIDQENLPLPDMTRDALYVGLSTDTGSFQYDRTTARSYEIAAELVRRGLRVGEINAALYDAQPFRRVQLLQTLLNSLEREEEGQLVHWSLTATQKEQLGLRPEDSEGMSEFIRSIDGVVLSLFFEELPDGLVRVSVRSKSRAVLASDLCQHFGGGGHALAAGIRMPGPLAEARQQVLEEAARLIRAADLLRSEV